MRHKTAKLIETKADESGTFTALASVFGNVDLVGDRMMKGAFRKTLDQWRASGDPIPVILSHQWDDPMAMVGKADPRAVMETDDGLVVQGQLDLDNPIAKQVHKLMSERLLKGWSFGYTVGKDGEKKAEDGANEVYEVDLIEVGPTLRGANSEAQLQEIKSALHEASYEEKNREALAAERKLVEDAVTKRLKTYIDGPEDEDPDEDVETSPDEIEEEQPDEEPVPAAKSRSQDPLRTSSLAAALEVLSDGASLRKYQPEQPEPEPEPPSEDQQRRRFCELYI